MIVSRWIGSFVALDSLGSEGTGIPAPEVVMHFEPGGNSSAVVYLVPECFWCFVGFVFGVHHPNLPLYFCKWGNSVPIHIVLLLPVLLHWVWLFLCLGLNFYGWFRTGSSNSTVSRMDWPTFLNSKRFPDICPVLGHGVLAWTGVFSSGGECSLEYLLVRASDPLTSHGPQGLLEVAAWSHWWSWAWLLPSLYIFLWESVFSSFQLL